VIKKVNEYYKLLDGKITTDMYGFQYSETDPKKLPIYHLRKAHIWPAKTKGRGLELFDLQFTAVNDPRNFLALPQRVEKYFDSKAICFDYDFIHKTFITNVLDPSIRDLPLFVDNSPGGKGTSTPLTTDTIGDLHGRPLLLPPDCFPFRRLLDHHAEFAHRGATLADPNPTPVSRTPFGNARYR